MQGKEKLLHLLSRYIPLSEEEKVLVINSLKSQMLPKGGHFLEVGTLNQKIAFIESGLIRGYYDDEEGEEITSGFIESDSLCTDLESYQRGGRSHRNLVALVDCQLWVIELSAMESLRLFIEGWMHFEQKYMADLLLKKVHFQRKIASANASRAYEVFMEFYPQAARFAPRYQIASFLGISPYTLSRIKI